MRVLSLFALAICLAGGWVVLDASQGMGRATSAVRAGAAIETSRTPAIDLHDVARDAGVTAINVSGHPTAKQYILETTGNGVALFDADGDGLIDVFLPNGTTLDGGGNAPATAHLYRNLGGMRFEDVTQSAGLASTGWGQGACVGDYDSDGARDLFVTHYGHSVLYRNNGDGTFRDATVAAGLRADDVRWDVGCTFIDYDRDGRLDLMVTNYLAFDRETTPLPGASSFCQWKGAPVICGPRGLPFAKHFLFHNEGNGRFADVSRASGIDSGGDCYGFGVVASDFDNDGYLDLYVACDSTPSLLYRNQRDGTFRESGLLSGVAFNADGQVQGGMGLAVADYDEDGDTDIFKTNFSDDLPNLYHNLGRAAFEDHVLRAGVGVYTQYVGWGAHFLDVDNDGLKDLFVVNGHVYPDVPGNPAIQYRQPRLLFWNIGGRFADISSRAGPGLSEVKSSRGSAVGDLDNDGALEIVIVNMGESPTILKNVAPLGNWLMVQCVGRSDVDALGARVRVQVDDRWLHGEVLGGSSYLSQSDPRLHFGLGAASAYQAVEVRWPTGEREQFDGGPANQHLVLEQGTGTAIAGS